MNDTTTETRTWQVYDINRSWLVEQIEKINRRAKRMNVTPLTLVEGEPYEAIFVALTQNEYSGDALVNVNDPRAAEIIERIEARGNKVKTYIVRDCQIDGETPRIADWDFVGAIQHLGDAGNLTRVAPMFTSLDLPRRFHTSTPEECDHCNTRRRRNETYIIHNTVTDEWKQVGSTCLRDFTGLDPKRALNLSALLYDVVAIFDDACSEEYFGSREQSTWNLTDFLGWVSKAIRENGWLARGKAYEQGGVATADDACSLHNRHRFPVRNSTPVEAPTEADYEQARAVVEWGIEELAEKFDTLSNDYLLNLAVIFRSEFVTDKGIGLAASAVKAWERAENKKATEAEAKAKYGTSEHVGTVGERREFVTLTCTHAFFTEGMYGPMTIFTFRDESGNIIKWFGTGKAADRTERGGVYTGKATVKKHGEWKDAKETVVNRPALKAIKQD